MTTSTAHARVGVARTTAALRLLVVAVAVASACRGGRTSAKPPAPAGPTPSGAKPASGAPPAVSPAAPRDTTPARPAPDTTQPKRGDSATSATPPTVDPAKRPPARKPAPASRNCLLDLSESPPETRLLYQRISEGVSNTFIGGGFVGRCQGERNRLRADSAEQFEAAGVINLYGNVVYEEPNRLQVRAAHAIYLTREGRLFADGGVVATETASGSTFTGATMEYYRAMPDRPVARLVAPNRSTATLIEKDSATGKPGPPTTVTANRFEDAGDSLLFAWGDVVIVRQQLNGRSDSAMFDKVTERSRLVRSARIVNSDTARQFTLSGDTIDLFSTQRQLDRVIALHKGQATTGEMQLDAERIDLRLKAQQLTEAFAFGTGRARAKTRQQDLDADSLRIRMSDKVVREVHAIGGARAVGDVDTLKIKSKDRPKDVLRGDSIFAYFDSSETAVRDTTKGPAIREIRALGTASSLFHMPSNKGATFRPSINYVRGVRIFVNFDTGAVRAVRVDSQAYGIFVEPEDSTVVDTAAARDSATARRRGAKSGAPAAKPPAAKATTPAAPASKSPAKPPAKPPALPDPIDPADRTALMAPDLRRRLA